MFRPLVWATAAFAAGIAAARWTVLSSFAWLMVAAAAAAAACVFLRLGRSAQVALLVGAVGAGAVWSSVDAAASSRDPFAAVIGRNVSVRGLVAQPPQVLTRGARTRTRVRLAVDRVHAAGTGDVRGSLLIMLPDGVRVAYGDRLRVHGRVYHPPAAGNPGEVSYRDRLAAAGIDAAMTARRAGDVRVLERGGGNPILAAAYGLRARMTAFFRAGLPGAPGALLSSLLLGDDGSVPPTMREAFRAAGLLHVLVVSGAQVALVLGSVVWFGRLVRSPPLPTAAAGAAAVAFFALMTGWVPSVARATVMAMVGIAALVIRRDRDAYTAFALAALVLLIAEPSLLADVGFQLSFAATWGLLYVAPAVAERLPFRPRWVRSLVSMTVGAQLAVLPLLAHHFGRISVAGFVANLVVVPAVGLLVPAGFAAALVGLTMPALGASMLAALRPVVLAVIASAEFFSRAPGAAVAVSPPGPLMAAAGFAVLVVIVEVLRGRIRITGRRAIAGGCLAAAVLIWWHVVVFASPGRLVLTVLDVGQGDAILVQAPGGGVMLIDGGGEVEGHLTGYDIGAERVVPALRRLGVQALDVVVISHPHEDHVGGLVAVLKNFRVGLVLDPGLPHPSPSYVALLRWIDEHGIAYRLARRGVRIDLGAGVQAVVLHPDEPLLQGTNSDPNLNSVVLRVTFGGINALLPGDLEAPIEWQLLEAGDDLHSAILKVAHHGSATSSTPEFLDAVRPAVAVISVGVWNPFGHPHPRTLAALEDAGAVVYRTDQHGAITLATDGRRLWVSTVRHAGDR